MRKSKSDSGSPKGESGLDAKRTTLAEQGFALQDSRRFAVGFFSYIHTQPYPLYKLCVLPRPKSSTPVPLFVHFVDFCDFLCWGTGEGTIYISTQPIFLFSCFRFYFREFRVMVDQRESSRNQPSKAKPCDNDFAPHFLTISTRIPPFPLHFSLFQQDFHSI